MRGEYRTSIEEKRDCTRIEKTDLMFVLEGMDDGGFDFGIECITVGFGYLFLCRLNVELHRAEKLPVSGI